MKKRPETHLRPWGSEKKKKKQRPEDASQALGKKTTKGPRDASQALGSKTKTKKSPGDGASVDAATAADGGVDAANGGVDGANGGVDAAADGYQACC